MTTSSRLSFTTAPASKNRAIGHEKRLGVDSVERRLFVLVVACASVSPMVKRFSRRRSPVGRLFVNSRTALTHLIRRSVSVAPLVRLHCVCPHCSAAP
uniref:Uncharacterized protein n=1 Tax=Plectus sambesii TaxID=2011161 RepID=A0A914WJG1_9BILA